VAPQPDDPEGCLIDKKAHVLCWRKLVYIGETRAPQL
jgi:hypothetical protein